MKQILLRTSTSLFTFIIGISLVFSYQAILQHRVKLAREAELRRELYLMRGAIIQYSHDKGTTPNSLKQLVEEGYLREIPIDPITEKRDWTERTMSSGCIHRWDTYFVDVGSTSTALSSEGTPYSQW
jgi:general secretion pathway protein G